MSHRFRSSRSAVVAVAAGLVLAAPATALASYSHPHRGSDADRALSQVNLISSEPGLAPLTDPELTNPWGISLSASSPLWVSDQGTDSSTAYSLTPGESSATKSAVQVTLPDSVLGPSGQVANTGSGFVVSAGGKSAPAAFIFATLDGHIAA